MKPKMLERMKNYAGAPKPILAVRVRLESGGEGIFPAHPNKKVKDAKVSA